MIDIIIKHEQNNNPYSIIYGAQVIGRDVVISTDVSYKDSLILNIYNKKSELITSIDMANYSVNKKISSVVLKDAFNKVYGYDYVLDGEKISDVYKKHSLNKNEWMSPSLNTIAGIYCEKFNWDDDKKPQIPNSDTISYLINVRGYTMLDASVVKTHRGTFAGVKDKAGYLSELGINQVILMPAYDFDEVIPKRKAGKYQTEINKNENKPGTNYWGYTNGAFYSPKSAFANRDSVTEFKDLVKELHKRGIEVIMQFYFPEEFNSNLCTDVLDFWAIEYHVDGFYIMGIDVASETFVADSKLSDTKLFFASHNIGRAINAKVKNADNLLMLNNEFQTISRCYLKSDEGIISSFLEQMRKNSADFGVLNYITSNEGFTLNDLVSFDYKHNENNGENNRDGNDFNYSWNCGVEGITKKKSVNDLRIRQIKNILCMLFMAQGIPMLTGGDENLNTQLGNNNAYCQDNEIGWTDWKKNKDRLKVHDFVADLICFRKSHPILHMNKELSFMDDLSCGYPELSYHSDEAWRTRLDNYIRHIGIMLCGKYAKINDRDDSFIYLAFNMHWEEHDFALPKLPAGNKWKLEIYTGDAEEYKAIEKSLEDVCESITIPYRSVAILKSVEPDNGGKKC